MKIKHMLISFLTLLAILASACSSAATPKLIPEEPAAQVATTNPPTYQSTQPMLNGIQEQQSDKTPSSQGPLLIHVKGSYEFSEGPATDQNGNVNFSDIITGKIYKWTPDGSVTVFLEGLNMPNGLAFDGNSNLIVCEGGNGRLISINPQGGITVLVDQYNGVRFNEPNDLWIDPQGGIYFTDPAYQSSVVQNGEHVYYLWPDRSKITRVISDMVRPNGIVGTADGTTLYVADNGAGQTYAYTINNYGTLSNRQLFASTGSDGMTLDTAGKLYLTTPNQVQIFDADGNHLTDIPTLENPTNVTFAGANGQTLFITARTAVYTFQMAAEDSSTEILTPSSGFTLTSPDLPADGRLPVEYTCDGTSASLALNRRGAPDGTAAYAVIMHHVANPEDVHWYWVVYNLPADVTGLPKNSTGIGTLGTNSVNGKMEYAPPCSKGPGDKVYTYTVYALSAQPQLSVPTSEVDRATLLEAIQDITLASAELNVSYARP
jgi:gluconolactonase